MPMYLVSRILYGRVGVYTPSKYRIEPNVFSSFSLVFSFNRIRRQTFYRIDLTRNRTHTSLSINIVCRRKEKEKTPTPVSPYPVRRDYSSPVWRITERFLLFSPEHFRLLRTRVMSDRLPDETKRNRTKKALTVSATTLHDTPHRRQDRIRLSVDVFV